MSVSPTPTLAAQFPLILLSAISVLMVAIGAMLTTIYAATASFAGSIVLLSATFSVLLFPVTTSQVRVHLVRARLQPQLDQLRIRWGKDPSRLAVETSALYRASGVTSLAGCLPALVSAPVYLGLFRVLNGLAHGGPRFAVQALHRAPTSGFVRALAAAPGMHSWGVNLAQGGIAALQASPWSALFLVILVVAVVAAGVISQRLLGRSVSGTRSATAVERIGAWSPAVFGLAALVLPLGVSLYYATSGMVRVGQLWMLTARTP